MIANWPGRIGVATGTDSPSSCVTLPSLLAVHTLPEPSTALHSRRS